MHNELQETVKTFDKTGFVLYYGFAPLYASVGDRGMFKAS